MRNDKYEILLLWQLIFLLSLFLMFFGGFISCFYPILGRVIAIIGGTIVVCGLFRWLAL
jgi:hypothetical protein